MVSKQQVSALTVRFMIGSIKWIVAFFNASWIHLDTAAATTLGDVSCDNSTWSNLTPTLMTGKFSIGPKKGKIIKQNKTCYLIEVLNSYCGQKLNSRAI